MKKGDRAMEKKYTAPFTARQVRNMVVGAIFYDHGKKMRVTRIGTAYIDSTDKPAFDSWAVPESEDMPRPTAA
jgi:hypothetical protein